MKKGKKVILCSLLVLFFCLGNVYSAMFVTDLLQIINTIKAEVQNAIQRVQERIQWSQEIKNMNDSWAQIQRYYEELKGLDGDLVSSYSKLAQNITALEKEIDGISEQCDEIIEKSDENIEEMYDMQDAYEQKQEEINSAYWDEMRKKPLKTYEDVYKINQEYNDAVVAVDVKVNPAISELNKQITEQREFWRTTVRAINSSNTALQEVNNKISEESENLSRDIQNGSASQKSIEQRQVLLTITIAKRDSLETKIETAKEKRDDIEEQITELKRCRDELIKAKESAEEKQENSKKVVKTMEKRITNGEKNNAKSE